MAIDKQAVQSALDRRYAELWSSASSTYVRSRLASDIIARLYDDFYQIHVEIPSEAKRAFQTRDWQRSLRLSRLRIDAFGDYRDIAIQWFRNHANPHDDSEALWEDVYRFHLQKIAGIYQGDIAYAFLSSVRRGLTNDRWRVVDYSYARATGARRPKSANRPKVTKRLLIQGECQPSDALKIIGQATLDQSSANQKTDSENVARRINEILAQAGALSCEIITIIGGFFRNRGCYIVGWIEIKRQEAIPFSLALLNNDQGIHVDAMITGSDALHNIFTSSLANFHITNPNFHEVVDCLHQLMPKRPRGLHYATIGYNHVGKLAILRQIEARLGQGQEHFDYALGPRGSVAIGFTTPELAYVLKVIRDEPTSQYKWEHFPGVDAVLDKYRQVHEINRAGSMLDNVIFENVALPACRFSPELRAELLSACSENIAEIDGQIVFRHLIVQMKMVPLPQFLQASDETSADEAISSLGRCIRNNAAANIFNRDLDGRNYGVGPTHRVYLFDYDAVETLTSVKVRTNTERFDGEEEVPDWFFEDGIIFLPEEIELHLRLENRAWRQSFRREHSDLLTVEFWENRQSELRAGQVPIVTTYPESMRFPNAASSADGSPD